MRALSLLCLALLLAASAAPAAARDTLPADLHLIPVATDTKPRPWAILFPRAEGIGRLAPGNQYADLAAFLNQRGIDVLVVDDDAALERLRPPGSAGEKRAAIAIDALARLRAMHRFDRRCPGLAIGWSRGGEGALTLASTPDGSESGFRAAIVYYPSVRSQRSPWPQRMPVLALQGTQDDTAPLKRLEALAATRVQNPGYPFIIKLYPGAGHRFDVAHPVDDPGSAAAPRDFNATAHAAALEAIDGFLTERAISGASCALD
ncbi:dienelactone hydrolase family protein [Sphingopyxis flava]|uniref:Dienelactone hydrolase n=1 Tax=Sphingopyxis flava TaxID=1507287 RepID=A0A1T5DF69_9SPHN|nr:dienelactone hydrolase family protein [Sphingopyxis flava]SKB70354.1 Dienelactone hydrolase [Sphingopyxis flava]